MDRITKWNREHPASESTPFQQIKDLRDIPKPGTYASRLYGTQDAHFEARLAKYRKSDYSEDPKGYPGLAYSAPRRQYEERRTITTTGSLDYYTTPQRIAQRLESSDSYSRAAKKLIFDSPCVVELQNAGRACADPSTTISTLAATQRTLELEIEDLRSKCSEYLTKKLQLEKELEQIKREKLSRLETTWIEKQQERDSNSQIVLQETKLLLYEHQKQIEESQKRYEQVICMVDQYRSKIPTCNCAPLFSYIEFFLKTLQQTFFFAESRQIETNIVSLLKQFNETNYKPSELPAVLEPDKKENDIELQFLREEQKELSKDVEKWKNMYTSLLAAKSSFGGGAGSNLVSSIKQNKEIAQLKLEINDKISENKKLQEKLKILTSREIALSERERELQNLRKEKIQENANLKQRLRSMVIQLNELQISLHESTQPKKNETMLESATTKDFEETINKLSRIILGKYDRESLSEIEVQIVRHIFGEEIMGTVDSYQETISSLQKESIELLKLIQQYQNEFMKSIKIYLEINCFVSEIMAQAEKKGDFSSILPKLSENRPSVESLKKMLNMIKLDYKNRILPILKEKNIEIEISCNLDTLEDQSLVEEIPDITSIASKSPCDVSNSLEENFTAALQNPIIAVPAVEPTLLPMLKAVCETLEELIP